MASDLSPWLIALTLAGTLWTSVSGSGQAQYFSNNVNFDNVHGANIDMLLTHEINRSAALGTSPQGAIRTPAGGLSSTDVPFTNLHAFTAPFVSDFNMPDADRAVLAQKIDQVIDQMSANRALRKNNLAYALASLFSVALEMRTGNKLSATQWAVLARNLSDGLVNSALRTAPAEQRRAQYVSWMMTTALLIVLSGEQGELAQSGQELAASVLQKLGVRLSGQ